MLNVLCLQMGIHPKELHRDYFLRRLRYSNHTSLNVTMTVGEDNKASIYVVLDKNTGGQDFFACDAGCLDPPVVLSSSWKQLPVKITEPLTAILYITPDLTHVRELKQAIHVKEVAIAPPHEHQLIAMVIKFSLPASSQLTLSVFVATFLMDSIDMDIDWAGFQLYSGQQSSYLL